jgi:hypothetical protein
LLQLLAKLWPILMSVHLNRMLGRGRDHLIAAVGRNSDRAA